MAQNYIKTPLSPDVISDIQTTLINTIQTKQRHKDYNHVVGVFNKSFAYTTGQGLDTYLHRFRSREDEDLFKQRCIITSHIVPAVINTCDFILNKVSRSSAIYCDYVNTDINKENNLIERENKFFANKSVYEFIKNNQRYYDRSDPNAWIIIEFNSTDGTLLAEPYPFIVNSKQAIDYEYINGILNYLIIEVESKTYKNLFDYSIYTPNQNIILKAQINEKILGSLTNDLDTKVIDNITYIRLLGRLYSIEIPIAHNIGWVQAKRFGYKYDGVTYGRTFVPFWWDAEPYLNKIININSELDITLTLHNFPQKLIYTNRCNAEGCNKGYLPDNSTCGVCGGTGRQKVHTTGMDVLEFAFPDSKEEMIELSSLIAYIYPPIDGIRFTNEKLSELIKNCKEAIYNSDTYTRAEISQTATGLNIGMESIYDTLYPYAVNFADTWKFCIETISKIIDSYDNLIVTATVEKDFKFKTKAELIAELNFARLSGANESVIRAIQYDLMLVTFDEKPSELIRYQTKDKFNPFSGKGEAETIALMSGNLIPKKVKVLYANFGNIFDSLENENENFYELSFEKQKVLIDAKVDILMNELEASTPELDLNITEDEE